LKSEYWGGPEWEKNESLNGRKSYMENIEIPLMFGYNLVIQSLIIRWKADVLPDMIPKKNMFFLSPNEGQGFLISSENSYLPNID